MTPSNARQLRKLCGLGLIESARRARVVGLFGTQVCAFEKGRQRLTAKHFYALRTVLLQAARARLKELQAAIVAVEDSSQEAEQIAPEPRGLVAGELRT